MDIAGPIAAHRISGGLKPLRRLLSDRAGAAAVEFALIVPAFLLLLLGIMELGRLMWTQNALHYAVEEAARCSAVDTNVCSSTSTAKSFAAGRSGLAFATSVFTVTQASCGWQVSASYPFSFVGFLSEYSVTLHAQACYPTT